MGQDPRESGTVTTEDLRRDIEQAREELGDTAAALGAKADFKSRAKERANEIKSNPPVPLLAAAGVIAVVAVVTFVARRRGS
jgi:uncharacterized protein DUF3618